MYEIREATSSDAAMVAAMIRPDDRRELAAIGLKPLQSIVSSLAASSKSWVGLVDNVPVCIFGVSEWGDGTGRPWMIGTVELEEHQRIFIRKCKECVESMQDGYELLHNYVDARNERAIAWLKWLGFVIGDAKPLGMRGEMFHHFWRFTK
ncbi:MAG: hypothetical protein ACRCWC_13680 [Plesiomonas shigelloides]